MRSEFAAINSIDPVKSSMDENNIRQHMSLGYMNKVFKETFKDFYKSDMTAKNFPNQYWHLDENEPKIKGQRRKREGIFSAEDERLL